MRMDVQPPGVPGESPGRRSATRRAVAVFATGLAGSAVLGVLGGLLWGEVAPRALLREASSGEAAIVNAETRAFIGADVWFCGIAAVAGLLTGILGYLFLVARQGGAAGRDGHDHRGRGHSGADDVVRAVAATGLILGAVAGALVMMWLGGQIGLSGYRHALAGGHSGTLFEASLSLGAKSALAFWPFFTSAVIAIAEWSSRRTAASPEPPAPGPLRHPAEGSG